MQQCIQILVMGVSGSGKSTVGSLLADQLKVPFLEGDSYHSPENVSKMESGISLTDDDRWPWLKTLAKAALNCKSESFVMACSALKDSYRIFLKKEIGHHLQVIYLSGKYEMILSRMQKRDSHFMPSQLLKSQFDTLEPPQNSWTYSIQQSPENIANTILKKITMKNHKTEIGVLGLGVMGKSLARNFASRNIKTSVYNVPLKGEENITVDFIKKYSKSNFRSGKDLKEFIQSISQPRPIIMMIKAGEPVDEMIAKMTPLLDEGDILIDGGNSFYKDTIRRFNHLREKGIEYVGMGVSGGEEGALKGPAIMPAGTEQSRTTLLPLLQKIAAKADGFPCVDWIGKDGAGHFVKMVHNGIEYADMQLLTEIYAICKNVLGYKNNQIADLLESWKTTLHDSYLLDITIDILRYKDQNGEELLEQILDVAGHKGTGLWTSKEALALGVPIPTIASAMNERILSSKKELRQSLSSKESTPNTVDINIDTLRDGFLFSRMIALAEGFNLIKTASEYYHWDVNLPGLAQVWRGGCIIRSQMLKLVIESIKSSPDASHLLSIPKFNKLMVSLEENAFDIGAKIMLTQVSTPALSASISYYKSLKTGYLPINLIQAQRDYFGAHTYRKIDAPHTPFHTEWSK